MPVEETYVSRRARAGNSPGVPYTRSMKSVPPLTLRKVNAGIHQVLADGGDHVGNLKWIGGVWKFKAIGRDGGGDVIPGGGPYTNSHNATFATLDLELINATLRRA